MRRAPYDGPPKGAGQPRLVYALDLRHLSVGDERITDSRLTLPAGKGGFQNIPDLSKSVSATRFGRLDKV